MSWLFMSLAWAHGGVSRTVKVDADSFTVDVPAAEVAAAMGLPMDGLSRHQAAVAAWMTEGLELTADGQPCTVGPASLAGDERLSATREVSCAPGTRTLSDATLASAGPGEQTLVVANDAPLVLDRTRTSVALASAGPLGTVLGAFLLQGALHLVTGFDHVLFLLCLLFVAGPTAARDGLRAGAGQLAQIVTAFTIGHSLTLVAAALELVVLPSRWVEATIALSIVLAAAMNVVRPNGTVAHRPRVALLFGLVHGFGFSSALAELGLPLEARVGALFAFNVGIELAQLAVVCVAVAPRRVVGVSSPFVPSMDHAVFFCGDCARRPVLDRRAAVDVMEGSRVRVVVGLFADVADGGRSAGGAGAGRGARAVVRAGA